MKKWILMLLISTSGIVCAQEVKVPKNKWFDDYKGYLEALELQKQTGADLIVYFARYFPKDEKGLCHWFESQGLGQQMVRNYLEDYIKVKLTYPLHNDEEQVAVDFHVGKCPAVYIVKTNGWHSRCSVFDWSAGQPRLLDPRALVELFKSNSDLRYQEEKESN